MVKVTGACVGVDSASEVVSSILLSGISCLFETGASCVPVLEAGFAEEEQE